MSSGRSRRTPPPRPDGAGPVRGLESARLSSSLPSGVFRVRSPDVEQALADGVADVFLRHMSRVHGDQDVRHGEPLSNQAAEERNRVTDDDVRALMAELHDAHGEPAPALSEGLAAERAWILVHLAFRGGERARQAAAIELLQAAERGDAGTRPEADALVAFCERFEAEIGDGPLRSVLLHAVRRAALAALASEAGR